MWRTILPFSTGKDPFIGRSSGNKCFTKTFELKNISPTPKPEAWHIPSLCPGPGPRPGKQRGLTRQQGCTVWAVTCSCPSGLFLLRTPPPSFNLQFQRPITSSCLITLQLIVEELKSTIYTHWWITCWWSLLVRCRHNGLFIYFSFRVTTLM